MKSRIHRWLIELQQHTFSILHRRGAQQEHVDALSRAPVDPPQESADLQPQGAITDLRQTEAASASRSADREPPAAVALAEPLPQCAAVTGPPFTVEDIIQAQIAADLSSIKHVSYHNGMKCITVRGRRRIILPELLVGLTLKHFHDGHGHPGKNKTTALISLYYWWPQMPEQIGDYIRTCKACQLVKGGPRTVNGELQLMPIPSAPMEILSMDTVVVGGSASATSAKVFHVVVDHLTRFVWATAARNQTAESFITALKKPVELSLQTRQTAHH